jgi:hypothetical protein
MYVGIYVNTYVFIAALWPDDFTYRFVNRQFGHFLKSTGQPDS